jgi:hypothetical protein
MIILAGRVLLLVVVLLGLDREPGPPAEGT